MRTAEQARKELEELRKRTQIICAVHAVIYALAIALAAVGQYAAGAALAAPLAKIFVGYDPALYQMTVRGFRLYAVSYLLCGFNIFGSSFFTALNNGLASAEVSFLRTLVFQCGGVLLLPVFLELDGVWLAITAAEAAALAVTLLLLVRNRSRYGY